MNVLDQIVNWNIDRNLKEYDYDTQNLMLQEELDEFCKAANYNDEYEQVDALADIIVVATGALYKLGYDPTEALKETLKEISSRKGKINSDSGKWEKDREQDPSTLYKAVYKKCENLNMEFIIIGIVSAINLIIIVHKFRKGRVTDGVFDSLLFTLMASMFSGSYGGMVVAMISSLVISIYLWASPPMFFRAFSSRKDVKEAMDDFKKILEPTNSKKINKIKDLDFD